MTKKIILIIDDEKIVQLLLKTRLEANGFEVVIAHDGNEGLEMARSKNPDLIILDIRMPNKDGISFLNDFRADDSTNHTTPVIILTADEQIADLYKKERNLECMTKPFKSELLLEKIKKYI